MLPACRRLQNEQLQRAASAKLLGASPVSSIAPQWQLAVMIIVSLLGCGCWCRLFPDAAGGNRCFAKTPCPLV